MKIIVAPDSFKECLPAKEVARAIASSIRRIHPECTIIEVPLADGGEGTVEVLVQALGGSLHAAQVQDSLGRPVIAQYGIASGTAIIEAAQACGLHLLSPSERDPLSATTFGLGELLLEASRQGCRHFIIRLGGTATCDGGEGMLSVPGIVEAMKGASVEILCDVDSPFVGPRGAARVFGPQKGARPEEVDALENRMLRMADRILSETGTDVSTMPGAGAAGGLGGTLAAYSGGKIQPGIDRILDILHLKDLIQGADMVITGEGRSDSQTLSGKAAFGVLRRCCGVPVALLSGQIEDEDALLAAGFSPVIEVSPRNISLNDALKPESAMHNLAIAVRKLF